MKPHWVIQTNIDGIDTSDIVFEVNKQGMNVTCVEHRLSRANFNGYNRDACIVCYGDIDFVRQVRQRAPFIPGAWCNFENMRCSTYYAYLGEHLLNKQYIMMPIGDLIRRLSELTAIFQNNSLFVRPDSGAKPFTGQVISSLEKHKIKALIQTVGPATLIVVASARDIAEENRFVICDRKVIAGSRYLPDESPRYKNSFLRLADQIAKHEWQPDLCYTVDVAESEGKVYLLEINSFSCSGFYQCNIKHIVKSASVVATTEWEEYRPPEGN